MKDQLKKCLSLRKGFAAAATLAVTACMLFGLTACGDPEEPAEDATTTTASSVASTTASATAANKATTTTANDTTTTTTSTAAVTTTVAAATTTNATTAAPTTVTTAAPTTTTTQPTSSSSEMIGAGSKSEPYLEHPTENMTVTTVSIPSGSSVYYGIYRVGGMVLTIENANAYVVCDGTRYEASGGKVTFTVPNALASDAVIFEIGNKGAAASFTLTFNNQKGSYMSPVVISTLEDTKTISLPKDAETGYYYRYVASQSGKLRLYMTASVDSVMVATNNRNSAQRTTEADALTDTNGKTYIELDVQVGDEIQIQVAAQPNKRGKYPATDISWNGKIV